MTADIVRFFALQRHIFGICPRSGEFFRLSDCRIFPKRRPALDWMEEIRSETRKFERAEARLDAKEGELRDEARDKGRRRAKLIARRIDPIFTPRKLDPDDAKVIFHPIDYIVFKGMKSADAIKRIILLDRKLKRPSQRSLQKSIERVIEHGNYEWLTLRVQESGRIKVE